MSQEIAAHTKNSSPWCPRCQSLQLDKYIATWKYGSRAIASNIAADSIQDTCAVCELLSECIEAFQAHSIDDSISIFVHHNKGVRSGSGHDLEMVYFSISTTTSYDRNFWLFPAQKELEWQGEGEEEEEEEESKRGTGRAVEVLHADLALARSWLDICRVEHTEYFDRCTPTELSPNVPLKTIDCRTRKVRPLNKDESYICLSYVWGAATVDTTFDGSVLSHNLPKTIEDAIWVALALDVPRIWVDQYCIDQKNLEEKMATITAMDRIYGGAELTIIGAGGDASSGLPGVRGTPRAPQRVVRSEQCSLVAVGDICHEIRSSRWNTRGWTYQEGMLAPRRLIFAPSQMYFQCNEMYCLESLDTTLPIESVSGDRELKLFSGVGGGFSLGALYKLIVEYFPRQLSFGSDSLNAFEGIMNKFTREMNGDTKMKSFYGMPVFHNARYESHTLGRFADCLLWRLESSAESVQFSANKSRVPSWSWAATKANHPSAGARTLFEYVQRGVHHPEELSVSLQHRSGQHVELVELITTFWTSTYNDFLPLLVVSTWTVKTGLISGGSAGSPSIEFCADLPTASIHLDEVPTEDGKVVALYLGVLHFQPKAVCSGALNASPTIYAASPSSPEVVAPEGLDQLLFLLVREVGAASFHRVGILEVGVSSGPEQALEKLVKSNTSASDVAWEIKSIRIL